MLSYIGPPIVVALGLVAWPVILSFRVKRWGQALFLMAASVAAPFVGTHGALLVTWLAMGQTSALPWSALFFATISCWIAAVAAPIIMGLVLHRLGRFTPPRPMPTAVRRTPDA